MSAAFVLTALALLASPAACSPAVGTEAPAAEGRPRVAEGKWGGRHAGLDVGGDGASVEYDCAHGSVEEPLVLDAAGRFEARGSHVKERPGPAREGAGEDSHPALYTGSVEGERMTLEVTLTDSGDKVGTFTLVRGQDPVLRKCQ